MTTVLLWLLVSLPGDSASSTNAPAVTVARFADVTECERVRKVLQHAGQGQPLMCIQARVVP